MLINLLQKAATRLRDQRGFTLIELLATMAAGMVVMAGLTTMLTVTLRETSRTFTNVDATQRGRTMLESIASELHSACVADLETPVQGGANGTQVSDANNLVFLSQFGTSASPTPVEHKITFNAGARTLTDSTYAVTGGTAPTWTFSSTPSSTKTLLTNVVATPSSGGGTVPVFQYFAYEPYTDANGNTDMMLMDGSSSVPGTTNLPNPDPLPTSSGLSQSDAASTAEVIITMNVGGSGHAHENTQLTDTYDNLTRAIVFRFTPAADTTGANATFNPCD
jgi:prepilin-type N-terminal cleavage/methylation domain-containing protein